MKKISTLFLLCYFSLSILAGETDKGSAMKVAVNFYYERIHQYEAVSHHDISIKNTFALKENGAILIYAINIEDGGFVFVSGTDNVRPVIGYSLRGEYTGSGLPPQLSAWLQQYKLQIKYAIDEQVTASWDIKQMWKRLISNELSLLIPLRYEKDVEPLLTTQWNQGQYYNEMCPADPAGPGGHCYAGCVATALGQVVNYFRWPETGTGSYTYSCPPYGNLTGDFENTIYEWDKMATALDKSNLAVALLLHHLGIACDMVYGPNGSGMYNHKAAYALRTFFKYDPSTIYAYRDSTSMDWDSLLISHLDRKIPMYYAGWSVPNINGHAFVCDGYQAGNYYHFNWGWGGSYDGYFYTDDLTPGGSNFNLAQEVVINAYPDTNLYSYPYYCQGDKTLNATDGTIDDGSGPVNDYLSDADCSWMIEPEDSVNNITLEFLHFNTANGDVINIYDGDTTSAPLLGTFQGPDIPDNITSSSDKILITFNTDAIGTAPGWLLSYTCEIPVYCNQMTNMTNQTDILSDGSGPQNYHNSSICMWSIEPPGASEVTIYFTSFNTEEAFDLVKVFDPETNFLLAEYSGDIIPDPVTSPSGKMFVTFSSNYTITAPGWEAFYETDLVSLQENKLHKDIQVFPNPATDQVNLSWVSKNESHTEISICNMNGIIQIRKEIMSKNGDNQVRIDVSELPAGIYLLEICNGADKIQQKLILQF
ncbi:MAG: C10 family peptidase [Bacteroidota bacterium]